MKKFAAKLLTPIEMQLLLKYSKTLLFVITHHYTSISPSDVSRVYTFQYDPSAMNVFTFKLIFLHRENGSSTFHVKSHILFFNRCVQHQ